jgi:hypothetical protein
LTILTPQLLSVSIKKIAFEELKFMLLMPKKTNVIIKGLCLGTICLFSPQILANPLPSVMETSTCESFPPLTNIVTPTVAEANTETPVLADSSCAKDLLGATEPIVQENSSEETTPTPPPEITPNPETPKNEGWQINFQPYATIPITTYGQVEIRGRTVDYSVGLGKLLEVLRVAVSGRVEAWNGNLGLIFDGYYVSIGGSGLIESSRPNVGANLESSLTFNQGIYDFAVSYHIGDRPIAYNPEQPSQESFPRAWFRPYAGTRLNDLSSTIETTVTFPRLNRSFSNSASLGRTWFEPLLGGTVGLQISEPVTLWLRGDASGFGLAGETDQSWNVIFGADWWVTSHISLQFAYRFYEINYGNGSGNNAFRFEQNFNGPFLSATFRF